MLRDDTKALLNKYEIRHICTNNVVTTFVGRVQYLFRPYDCYYIMAWKEYSWVLWRIRKTLSVYDIVMNPPDYTFSTNEELISFILMSD